MQTRNHQIERLEQLIAASQRLPESVEIPAVVLPEGAKVQSLEHLFSAPFHMAHTYRTERLADFCQYVDEESADDRDEAACFVAPDGSGATAIMDYGTHSAPRWGKHRAVLSMCHTSEFAALLKATQQPLKQRDMIDLLEDWEHILTPFQGGSGTTIARAVAAIRRVDIKQQKNTTHETADWSAARSSMEKIEAASGDQAMPDYFQAACRVYPHTQQRTIDLRLSLLTGDDTPRLRLRILGLEALMHEVAEEIELELRTRLQGIRVYVGQV